MSVKFRIVNKAKDGITLSPAKGAEPVKMGWKEFEENFKVVDDKWAVFNDEYMKKIEEADEYINAAAVAFITSGGLKGEVNDLSKMVVLGESVQKIVETLGCTNGEALALVRQRVDLVAKPTPSMFKKSKSFNKNKKSEKASMKKEEGGFKLLADNPQLLALKESLGK